MRKKETYQPQFPTPGYMSAEAAAAVLCLKEVTIRALAHTGTLTFGYIGNTLFVTEASVAHYALTRRPAGRPKLKESEAQA